MDNLKDSILQSLKDTVKEKMTEINSEIKNKLNETINKDVIDKGINVIQQRLGEYKAIGFAMYAIPVIILFYIVYLLNKYH